MSHSAVFRSAVKGRVSKNETNRRRVKRNLLVDKNQTITDGDAENKFELPVDVYVGNIPKYYSWFMNHIYIKTGGIQLTHLTSLYSMF